MQERLTEAAAAYPWTVVRKRERIHLPVAAASTLGLSAAPLGPRVLPALPEVLLDTALGPLPVTHVTAMEAHCFARWLGGRLPSDPQWLRAGEGLDDLPDPEAPGPPNDWPWPAGACPGDEVPSGCRDLARNGPEWTRHLDDGLRQDGTDPFDEPRKSDWFRWRGQWLGRNGPYRPRKAILVVGGPHGCPHKDVGFRVVIELPVGP
jgi:formylglycine-generating enzyme required for sulfatase activity